MSARISIHVQSMRVLLAGTTLCMAGTAFPAPAPDMARVLEQATAAYAKVNDYSSLMARKDRLSNGTVKEHSAVFFKHMRPDRYYMKWPNDLIELIYAGSKYDNKMLIHGGKIFSFLSLRVDPEAALKYNRHTIKEAGIGFMLNLVVKNYQQARTNKDATLAFEREDIVDGRPTWRFKGVFPANRGYYAHIVHLDIDQQYTLPVRIEAYGWNNEFLEMYSYSNLKLNIGLSEKDFDASNTTYSFGREVKQ